MIGSNPITRLQLFRSVGLLAAGVGLPEGSALTNGAAGEDGTLDRDRVLQGLDGMSRAADGGNDAFRDGHGAAAVISSAFFSREQRLGESTRREIASVVENRFLQRTMYAPRPKQAADPSLVEGLVKDLDSGIGTLRAAGHNIIFAVASLKALREIPEAATPDRIGGLRRMVRSVSAFRVADHRSPSKQPDLDLSREQEFIRFVFEEYMRALELFLEGRGHHGFAGHILTVGHSLVEMSRLGHRETAQQGVDAYWQFVLQARRQNVAGGRKVDPAPPKFRTPVDPGFWAGLGRRLDGNLVDSHALKYPYSFYALAKDLRDEALKQRAFEKVYHLATPS